LTIEKSGTGDGTINDNETACESADCLELFSLYADEEEAPFAESGIDCGETCNATYTEGTTVYLKAVAAEGSEFVEWQVNGEAVKVPLEMAQDKAITAVFEEVSPPEEEPDDPQSEQPQP